MVGGNDLNLDGKTVLRRFFSRSIRMTTVRNGLSYDDVLLVPQRSPVEDLAAVTTTSKLTPDIALETPVLSAPMDTVTEAEMATAMSAAGGMGIIHRFLGIDEQAAMVDAVTDAGERTGATIGINEDFINRTEALLDAGVSVVVVDIAHGHLDACLDAVRTVRDTFGDVPLVAGNVATPEAVEDFAAAGADCVKVGIGPGSHCTTRRVTGAGVPQFTAVRDCADAARAHGICSIADGGIRTSGEIVKALMAGADTVMLGGMFMGTDEAPGTVVEHDGQRYKKSRGMASQEAREERTDKDRDGRYAAEGVEGLTPYKGAVSSILDEIAGGLRSGISYCGADNIPDARENAAFIKVTDSARSRDGAHGHGIVERS
jgi:IMP dehydrogenase